MDVRQMDEYASYMSKIGWIVEENPKTKNFFYIKKLPLTPFSVLKTQRPQIEVDFPFLEKLIKKYRVIQSNIEPFSDGQILSLTDRKYKRTKIPFLPGNTILINLTIQKKILLKIMKSKTRYNIGLAKRKGVEVKTYDGDELIQNNNKLFDDLFVMQKQNAKRLGIFSLPKKWFLSQVKSFSKKCFATMAYREDQLVSAAFFLTSNDKLYYSHNGSIPHGRKFFAPSACIWEGMMEGKNRGLKLFDFEGIYDPRSKVVRWQGFTRFKKGFGGQETMYPGLYSKWHLFNS